MLWFRELQSIRTHTPTHTCLLLFLASCLPMKECASLNPVFHRLCVCVSRVGPFLRAAFLHRYSFSAPSAWSAYDRPPPPHPHPLPPLGSIPAACAGHPTTLAKQLRTAPPTPAPSSRFSRWAPRASRRGWPHRTCRRGTQESWPPVKGGTYRNSKTKFRCCCFCFSVGDGPGPAWHRLRPAKGAASRPARSPSAPEPSALREGELHAQRLFRRAPCDPHTFLKGGPI